MLAFLATPLGRYIAIGVVAVVLAVGAYAWIHHQGVVDERNRAAIRAAEEERNARKERETQDERARNLDDERAIKCLRNPTGC